MASNYKIDSFQQQYFVIDRFDALRSLTQPDFSPLYRTLRTCSKSFMSMRSSWDEKELPKRH